MSQGLEPWEMQIMGRSDREPEPEEEEMETFDGGAKRESRQMPRYDLIPPDALRRLAMIYTEGAERYGVRNWEKGIPFSNLYNHAKEHIQQYLEGDNSEDQLAKAAWGLFAMMHLEAIRPDLNDLQLR